MAKIEDIKRELEKMAEKGKSVERFVARSYLQEIKATNIDVADVVIEVKKSVVDALSKTSDDVVSSALGEYCKAVELELKTGKTILLVYMTPIEEL